MLADKILELKSKIIEMASIVEKMVSYAFEGIEKGVNRYKEVMEFEQRVNKLEMEIEDDCIVLMALQHPEAKDLRIILMIYKINNDLERLGDQAFNIAESVAQMTGNPLTSQIPDLISMKDVTLRMLTQSIEAYTNEDVNKARLVCRQDEIVDSYNRHIYNQIVALIKESPLQVEHYMHLLRIAKNLERIADLSTNIGENTVYLVQGRVIKHHQEENLVKEES
jgi:phosphate transport system protein